MDLARLLTNISPELRNALLESFNAITRNYRECRWEPSELNGGKLCEVVYSILVGYIDGKYPPKPSKPTNMLNACRNLEKADKTKFSRSVRIQIPRMLIALYELRNNRGVGHVGSDVDPNHMDSMVVLSIAKWIIAELIRVFHDVDTQTAHKAVDALTEREIPLVWHVHGKRRVLNTQLKMLEKVLVLLYGSLEPIDEDTLASWVEHSNRSVFRRDVLRRGHKKKLIDYDDAARIVHISPLGSRYVEQKILPEIRL